MAVFLFYTFGKSTVCKPFELKVLFSYYPENARFPDEAAGKENLKYSVADFRDTKKITLFSKKGLKVYALCDDPAFYQHAVNDNWFFNNQFILYY